MKLATQGTKEKRTILRKVFMGLTVICMGVTTAFSVSQPAADAAGETAQALPRRARTVLYVQDSPTLGVRQADARHIDQINYAFALLENGEATVSHLKGLKSLSRFLRDNPHIDGVLSVGGWGADGFSQACATEAGREKLADSILRVMDEHGFVGVDIDWEYPGSKMAGIAASKNDVENWYALLSLLREGLDARQTENGRDYLLSVALGAGEAQIASVDGARLGALVDQAVIMAYDLRGFDRMTGHHAGLYPDGKTVLSGAWAVNAYAAKGLPEAKMLMGVPLYGRMWRQVTSAGDGLNARAATSGNRAVTQATISGYLAEGYTRYYDEEAQAPYLFNGSNFISYDDKESVAAKAQWIRQNGLLGAAMWEGGQDENGELLRAVSEALTIN